MAHSLRVVALDYLARREHTRYELFQKLLAKGSSEEEAIALLDALERDKLQSDDRFSLNFFESRRRRGYGPVAIKHALHEKRVSAEIIEAVLGTVSLEDWQDTARRVWSSKFHAPAATPQEKAKQQRFMLQRGFTFEHFKGLL